MTKTIELNTKLNQKWRLLENAYGDYGKFTALEAEEIIVQTTPFHFKTR